MKVFKQKLEFNMLTVKYEISHTVFDCTRHFLLNFISFVSFKAATFTSNLVLNPQKFIQYKIIFKL